MKNIEPLYPWLAIGHSEPLALFYWASIFFLFALALFCLNTKNVPQMVFPTIVALLFGALELGLWKAQRSKARTRPAAAQSPIGPAALPSGATSPV